MKKIIVLVLLLCVAGYAQAELLINGDFETGDGWSGWASSGSGSGAGGWVALAATIMPTGGSDGGQYMNFDLSAAVNWGWCAAYNDGGGDVPTKSGDTITFDGKIRDISGNSAVLSVFFTFYDSFDVKIDLDGDGTTETPQEDRVQLEYPADSGGGWTSILTNYVIPVPLSGETIASCMFFHSCETGGGSLDLDECSLATDAINRPVNVYPANGAEYIPIDAVLEWGPPSAFDPCAYDVYFTTDPNANKPEHLVVDHKDQTTYDDPCDMEYNTMYYWRVNAYDPCDVILTPGYVWSFKTLPTWPVFTTDIGSVTVEAGSSAQMYVETPRTNTFQWWKEGTPDTQVNNGDDGGDVSVVSDGTSSTLTISNLEQADEGYYYCVATGTGSTESNHARLLTKRLMGHWKFNAPLGVALNDEVAGNNGTLVDPNVLNPAPTLALAAGINGQAINLGTGEIYVDIPNEEYFNFHAQGFTISGWVKTEQSGWGGIFSKADRSTPNTGWVLEHNSDTAYIKLRSAGSGGGDVQADFGGVTLTDNEWHMLAGTYDGQTGMLALYVDGEKRDEDGPFWTLTETDMALKIGSELSSDDPELENTNPYDGLIDDVKIFSYAQDGYEIATAYTTYVPNASICVEPVPGDLNGDCVINTGDLVEVVLDWLECDLVPQEACDE